MTIRHMKIFLEVYKTENITQAARQLHMTQPAVTRVIQEMEQHYGVRFFDRMNRHIFITEAGHRFYAQAVHIVEAFDRMEKELQNGDTFGIIRVGASISLGNFLMPKLAGSFKKEWPDMKIRVTISNGETLQRGLLDNELDLAFIEGGVTEKDLKTQVLSKDRLVLVLPPGHSLLDKEQVALEELSQYDFLVRERGSVGRTLLDHVFAMHGITLEPLWESASTQAIIKGVQEGIGVSVLPEMLVNKELAEGKICTRDIADEAFQRTHYIVWHKNKYLTKGAKAFIELAAQIASREAAEEETDSE